MDFPTRLFWAALDFLTLERAQMLKKYFGDLTAAAKNFSPAEFHKAGIPKRSVETLTKRIQSFDQKKTTIAFEKSAARLLFYEDADFPTALKQIPDPPMFLFLKGNLQPEDRLALSIVGTRQCSALGKQVISSLLPELLQQGFTIVSGMARGIDTEAHRETLRCGGRTIAIWGTGIDVVYPKENIRLAQEIAEKGAVLSEFPLGTEPNDYNFPRRNRLISGFSLGTLIVEGQEKSGSVITAKLALEQGKEVFAIPGSPFSPFAEATNRLIQSGEAKLVVTAQDILDEFDFVTTPMPLRTFTPESPLEQSIFEALSREPLAFDELVQKTEKNAHELSAALMMMAVKGLVKDMGMNEWVRNF